MIELLKSVNENYDICIDTNKIHKLGTTTINDIFLINIDNKNIDSKNINVIACRHLMYYGKNGRSFENLRQNIKKSLEKDKEIER